jgi:hypothetical protein
MKHKTRLLNIQLRSILKVSVPMRESAKMRTRKKFMKNKEDFLELRKEVSNERSLLKGKQNHIIVKIQNSNSKESV